jgi:hypothetical protein
MSMPLLKVSRRLGFGDWVDVVLGRGLDESDFIINILRSIVYGRFLLFLGFMCRIKWGKCESVLGMGTV